MSLVSNLAVQDSNLMTNPEKLFENEEEFKKTLHKSALSSDFLLQNIQDFELQAVQNISFHLLRKIFKNLELSLCQEEVLQGSSDLNFHIFECLSDQKTEDREFSVTRTELMKNASFLKEDQNSTIPDSSSQTSKPNNSKSLSPKSSNSKILNEDFGQDNNESFFSFSDDSESFTVVSKKICEVFEPCTKEEFLAEVKTLSDLCLVQEKTERKIVLPQRKKDIDLCEVTKKTIKKTFQPLIKIFPLPCIYCEETIVRTFSITELTRCEPWIAFETTLKTRFLVLSKPSCAPQNVLEKTSKKSFSFNPIIRIEPIIVEEKTISKQFNLESKTSCDPLIITEKTTEKIISVSEKCRCEPLMISEKTLKLTFSIIKKISCDCFLVHEKTTTKNFEIENKSVTEPCIAFEKTSSKTFKPLKKQICDVDTEKNEKSLIKVGVKGLCEDNIFIQEKNAKNGSDVLIEVCKESQQFDLNTENIKLDEKIEIVQKSIQNEAESSTFIYKQSSQILSEKFTENLNESQNFSINNSKTSNYLYSNSSNAGNFQIPKEDLKFLNDLKNQSCSSHSSSENATSHQFESNLPLKLLKNHPFNETFKSSTEKNSDSSNDHLFSINKNKLPETKDKSFNSFTDIDPVRSIFLEPPEKNPSPFQATFESNFHESIFESEFEFKSSSIITSSNSSEIIKISTSDFILIPQSSPSLKSNILPYEELKSESEDDFELI